MTRNGGVPQEGNIGIHLKEYEKALNEQIPDPNFAGKYFFSSCKIYLKDEKKKIFTSKVGIRNLLV